MPYDQVVPFRSHPRRRKRISPRQILVLALLAVMASGAGYFLLSSPWPLDVKVRHLLAATNCSMARPVGLAPSYRGQPGYHAKLDADGDGIACEPYPRR